MKFRTIVNLLGAAAEPERLITGVVSGNYFDVLGVKPIHGRDVRWPPTIGPARRRCTC